MDLLPNDGAMFDPSALPAELEKENREFLNTAENPQLTLDSLIDRCRQRIANADSLSGLGITADMPHIQVQIIADGNRRYINALKEDLEWLTSLKEAIRG